MRAPVEWISLFIFERYLAPHQMLPIPDKIRGELETQLLCARARANLKNLYMTPETSRYNASTLRINRRTPLVPFFYRLIYIYIYFFLSSNKSHFARTPARSTRAKIADRWRFRESFSAAQILASIVRGALEYSIYTIYDEHNGMLYGDSIYIGFFAVCYTYHGAPCAATACVQVSCKIDPRPFAKQVYHRQRVRKILYMERVRCAMTHTEFAFIVSYS